MGLALLAASLMACDAVGPVTSCERADGGHSDGEIPVSPLCPQACDDDAARAVVYNASGRPMYAGQALMVGSCAGGGNACHSRNADPALRYGAPFGLDYDLAPLALDTNVVDVDQLRGILAVQAAIDAQRNDIFESVISGAMPPGPVGASVSSVAYGWVRDPGNPATDVALPSLGTAAGQEILRNWLACGAPFIERWTSYELTTPCAQSSDCVTDHCVDGVCRPAGDVLPPLRRPIDANWSSIYPVLIAPCATCHSPDPALGGRSIGGLDLSELVSAREHMVNVLASDNDPTIRTVCGGGGLVLVRPFDPDHSLLVNLTDGSPAICGRRMASFVGPELDALRTWIASGACLADCALPRTAAHARASCVDEVCGLVCDDGFADLDLEPSNGCEASL